jgi:hypothetical protein
LACFPLLAAPTQLRPDRQVRKAANYRQLSSCLGTPASEASGLFGAVTKAFRETGGRRHLLVLSLAVLALCLMAPAAKAQTVINLRSEFTGATGPITLENLLVGGAIHLVLSQCGWAL